MWSVPFPLDSCVVWCIQMHYVENELRRWFSTSDALQKYFRSGISSLGDGVMNRDNDSKYLHPPLRGSDEKMDPLSAYCTNTWEHHSISLKPNGLASTHSRACLCMMIGTSLIQWLVRIQRGWRSCWACVPPGSSSTAIDFASTASPGPKSSRSPTNAITSTSRSVQARWEHHHVFSRWSSSRFRWSLLTRERLFVSSSSSLKAR